MTTRAGLLVTAMLLTTAIDAPISGQHGRQRVIAVFHDDVSLQSFGSGRLDARARANPAAWAYLDRTVVGAVQALEVQHGFRADHVYSEAVRGFAAELTDGQIRALQRDSIVAYVEPDTAMHLLEQTLPWGIDRIDTDISSTAAGDGAGAVTNVHVYVLDNGVDRTHPDLNVIDQVNFTNTANSAACAHGTRVAGVLAASDNAIDVVGALPGAPITAVKVTTCDPVFFSASSVIKGVDWVTKHAVKPAVANMSIGGPPNSTLDRAVIKSAARGILYAIAAGNQASDACLTSPQRTGPHDGIITVAGTVRDDSEWIQSSFGRCVDIWAPAVDILTTELGGGTATSSGTSYAAPHVAGTAGLYLSTHPAATPAVVENQLKADGVFTGTLSKDLTPVRLVYAGRY
jgi:subtilisin family serine protease